MIVRGFGSAGLPNPLTIMGAALSRDIRCGSGHVGPEGLSDLATVGLSGAHRVHVCAGIAGSECSGAR